MNIYLKTKDYVHLDTMPSRTYNLAQRNRDSYDSYFTQPSRTFDSKI